LVTDLSEQFQRLFSAPMSCIVLAGREFEGGQISETRRYGGIVSKVPEKL